jgi:hypothetical protein
MRTALSVALGATLVLGAHSAFAQDTAGGTATGTVGAGGTLSATPTEPQTTATATPTTTTTTTTTTTARHAAGADDETSDHEKVVGKFAVGYLGLTQVPLSSGTAGNQATPSTIDAPVVGVRYWLNEKMGIDAGLGLGVFSGGQTVTNGNTETSTDRPSAFALALHGGVPLVFAHQKHYKFLVIPEINVAHARRTVTFPGTTPQSDLTLTGWRLDLGGRVGSEIHFGFIGIPQLSLQATVGLALSHQRWGSSQDQGRFGPNVNQSATVTDTRFGTTVQANPWALFVNNISAFYYFP